MAIAVTAVINKPDYKSWTATALDADTTLAFNHGFTDPVTGASVAPDAIFLNAVGAALALTAGPNWSYTVSSTQITLNKLTSTGSGGASPGVTVILKVIAMRPHSIMQ